jgi:hypothetical protein
MADINIGRALSGLGAAFKNEMPAFMQQVRQEDALARGMEDRVLAQEEKRKETLFKDTATARQYLQSGNIPAIIDIYSDRVNLLGRAGIDTSNSERMLSYAQAALNDPNALSQLTGEINTVYDTGRAFNVGMGEMPSSYRALRQRALDGGLIEGSEEFQEFMRFNGAPQGQGSRGLTRFKDGSYIQITPTGNRVFDTSGIDVSDDPQRRAEVIKAGRDAGVILAGEIATATTRGGREEGRAQDYIVKGQSAADSTAVIRRSLALLEKVKTGGLGRTTMLAAKRMFGAEGANEGELSASLGKAVLAQLRETFGAAFTAQEGESLKEIEAGFGSSVETNTRLLNNSLRIAQRAADRGIRAAESRDDYESASEIEMALDFDLGVFESEYSSFGESVPPFPSAFAGSLTEEDWAKMTDTERSAFQ